VQGLVIDNVSVFVGDGEIIPSAHVVVDGGRILEVAAGAPGDDVVRDRRRVDGDGGWLVPGYLDAHVHLCYRHLGSSDATDEEGMAAGILNARVKLLSGVTTVRDVGAFHRLNLELRSLIRSGDVVGPRMLAGGDFLATVGGHCHYWAREVDGPRDAAIGAQEQLDAGADVIKIMASAGVADAHEDPNAQQLDAEELAAIVAVAQRHGAPVAAHAHPEVAIRAAVEAGCATIEHGTYLTDDVVDLMIDRGVAVVPTLAVYERMSTGADGGDRGTASLARAIWDEKIPRLQSAIARGVQVGVGTDSGSNYPADGYVRELELLVDLGMSPTDALKAATAGNAAILGLSAETGSIAAGLSADLVLLRTDPTADISACRDIRMVVAAGAVHEPTRLTPHHQQRGTDS